MPYRRRRRFGRRRGAASAVTLSTVVLKRKSKCRGCGQTLNVGETCSRLRLKKAIAVVGCVTCSRRLVKLKNYHTACCPADINKAMGYDPAAHNHGNVTYTAAPPPPKPKTTADLKIDALLTIEAALVAGIRDRSVPRGNVVKVVDGKPVTELDVELAKINNLKARIVRPGTPAEGDTAA